NMAWFIRKDRIIRDLFSMFAKMEKRSLMIRSFRINHAMFAKVEKRPPKICLPVATVMQTPLMIGVCLENVSDAPL
ncbi:MAG: hypothetical protein D3925_15800, partial [Candidatus Electrothrix sp. AR5]|nr:hypothetical protein [Candidatus Electrothrix sp. AR5]